LIGYHTLLGVLSTVAFLSPKWHQCSDVQMVVPIPSMTIAPGSSQRFPLKPCVNPVLLLD